LGCAGSDVVCTLLATVQRWLPLNTPAVWEMTAPARALERMAPPGVPTWTFAGTALNPGRVNDGYIFPNDMFVGSSSAWGESANLPSTRLSAAIYHGFLGTGFPWDAPGANEFNSSAVINAVVHVAEHLPDAADSATPGTGYVASVAEVTGPRKRTRVAVTRPVSVSLPLVGVASAKRTGGVDKVPAVGEMVVATREFGITCSGHSVLAPMVVPGIFGIDANALKCAVATLPKGVPFVTAAAPTGVSASVSNNGSVTIVTVSARRRVQSAIVVEGKRRLHLRSNGPKLFEIRLRLPATAQATLRLTVGSRVYRAAIP
jgi:hypothetical protein